MYFKNIASAKLLFIIFGIIFFNSAEAQSNKQAKNVKIEAKLINGLNEPLAKVLVTALDGEFQALSNDNGEVEINCPASANVTFELKGFETINIRASDIINQTIITLVSNPWQLSQTDLINMPFSKQYKRHTASAVSTLFTDDFDQFDAQQGIQGAIEPRLLGLLNGSNIRGMGSIVIVDGFVRDSPSSNEFISNLNVQEIDEISILKDPVSRILYGAYADKGIIMITTKRGKANTRKSVIRAESGVAVPTSYPSYMNAADYMQYYNYALLSDGELPRYTDEEISKSGDGNDPIFYPNTNLYNNQFLKDYRPSNRIMAEFSGGSMTTQYYLNMGWNHSGSIIKNDANNGTNTLNLRGNVDVKINDYIKATFDGVTVYDFNKESRIAPKNFWEMTEQFKPNEFPYLIPVDLISEEDSLIVRAAKKVQGNNILGGSNLYQQNPIGDMYLGGYEKTTKGFIQLNLGLDFDLKSISKGLTFKTKFGYDNYNIHSIIQNNKYAVYQPSMIDDQLRIEKIGQDEFSGNQSVQGQDFFRKMAWSNILNWKRTINDNYVDLTSFSFIDTYKKAGELYTERHANFGLKANYVYKEKYIADIATALVGTSRMLNHWDISPSLGLAWIASEEEFMKSINNSISFLKLKASAGIIKTDISTTWDSYYYYKDVFQEAGNFTYADVRSNRSMLFSNIGNPNLDWVKRKELNAGLELGTLNNDIMLEANYFRSDRVDDISKLSNQYPSFLGGNTFIPYGNYNAQSLEGFEAGINYTKSLGDFHLSTTLIVLYMNEVYTKVDEVEYEAGAEHLSMIGQATDAIRGLQALGLYTEEQINAMDRTRENPMPTYGGVKAGDIRYMDINGDGLINNNDRVVIGNSRPQYTYNLSFNMRYKSIELFTSFRAQTNFYGSNASNSYFGPVYGNSKYPEYQKDSWIYLPEMDIDTRISATLPRLSSKANTNNKQNSTFWLRKKDYLSMPLVQLTYNLPQNIVSKLSMNGLSVYVKGTNLFRVSEYRIQDEMNIGGQPQYRGYSVGLRAQF